MKNILRILLPTIFGVMLVSYGCKKEEDVVETCSDGIQNQDETGVDCGGSCDACATVFTEKFTAIVDNVPFSGNGLVSGSDSLGILTVSGSDGSTHLQLFVPEIVTPGTYSIDGTDYSILCITTEANYIAETGEIVVSAHDKTGKTISGTFHFEGAEILGTKTVNVTNGNFVAEYE